MWFKNFRMAYNLDRYLLARFSYQDWRDRYIVDSTLCAKIQRDGMNEEWNNMNKAVNKLLKLGAKLDRYTTLKDGRKFIIYSDPKCSIERKVWVKNA